MILYNETIKNINKLIESENPLSLNLNNINAWLEGSSDQIVFKNDCAYELGTNECPGLSGIAFTSDSELVNNDEVLLIGNNLKDIKEDSPYARIILVRVNEQELGKGNDLYQNLRKIDYTRYHLYPQGFMLRISTMSQRESVRVDKTYLKKGMSFENIGKFLIDKYKEHKAVEAVKVIFITKKDFNYTELQTYISKSEAITKTLDHLVNKVKMDCHSCALQKVCAEVENLCKEDFKK